MNLSIPITAPLVLAEHLCLGTQSKHAPISYPQETVRAFRACMAWYQVSAK